MERVIRIGDDTDTTAAIAGALLGARWGSSAVPAQWRQILHGWPGAKASDLVRLALLTARGGRPDAQGWPTCPTIDYGASDGYDTVASHPHDPGVLLSGAAALTIPPDGVDAVVTLCRLGATQVPEALRSRQIDFRLIDGPHADNPNLEFVLDDAARTVARLRDEGHTVLLHCVAAQSRTPTVAALYAVRRGVPVEPALREVCAALPAASPKADLIAGLRRLSVAEGLSGASGTLGP